MSIDIVIYAVVAIVIFARLWMVLGSRHDGDQQRPNPFVAPSPPPAKNDDDENYSAEHVQAETSRLLAPFRAAPASLAGGLDQIKSLDPSFDEKQFLQGARTAFATIVEDFAKGDLAQITSLLGPNVLPKFKAAIEARRNAGQVMETRVESIRDAEVAAASVEDTRARITVRFVTNQTNALRDSGGKVIGGAEGKLEEITDLWVFERDTKSPDPNWILVETKS